MCSCNQNFNHLHWPVFHSTPLPTNASGWENMNFNTFQKRKCAEKITSEIIS